MAKKTQNTTNTKTSVRELVLGLGAKPAGMVPDRPDMPGEAGFKSPGEASAVERKLDRIIELLEAIAGSTKNIPFQGLNMHWLEGRGEG